MLAGDVVLLAGIGVQVEQQAAVAEELHLRDRLEQLADNRACASLSFQRPSRTAPIT